MSLHLLTAQIAQYFCRLSTVPRAHPFSRASWMRGQEVGGGGMQPRHGSLRGPLISRPDTPVSSARGSGWALREVNVLPIVGFLCPLKQQKSLNHPPTHPPPKKKPTPKRQIVLTAFLVPNDKNVQALSYSYGFTIRHWKNPSYSCRDVLKGLTESTLQTFRGYQSSLTSSNSFSYTCFLTRMLLRFWGLLN